MVVWSKALPLTARCPSPIPGFESCPGHVKVARQWFLLGTPVSSASYNWQVRN